MDYVEVRVAGVSVLMERQYADHTPHELTVVLPRVEIRRIPVSCPAAPDGIGFHEEVIISSVTVVSSPVRPQASTDGD